MSERFQVMVFPSVGVPEDAVDVLDADELLAVSDGFEHGGVPFPFRILDVKAICIVTDDGGPVDVRMVVRHDDSLNSAMGQALQAGAWGVR